jgi:hypothetical protein
MEVSQPIINPLILWASRKAFHLNPLGVSFNSGYNPKLVSFMGQFYLLIKVKNKEIEGPFFNATNQGKKVSKYPDRGLLV